MVQQTSETLTHTAASSIAAVSYQCLSETSTLRDAFYLAAMFLLVIHSHVRVTYFQKLKDK